MELYFTGNSFKVPSEFLIKNTRKCKPHVVILGAGASKQTFPKGDRNGIQLPIMDNLIELIGLSDDFKKMGISEYNSNFENIYNSLFIDHSKSDFLKSIEKKIYDYFSRMKLPDYPTLYDHLILSLRKNDLIVTFNWDPLLFDGLPPQKRTWS